MHAISAAAELLVIIIVY